MPKFQKKSVIEQTADLIQESIRTGGWTGLLPSIRTLCSTYGLSLPTVHKALILLVDKGVLLRRGDKKRLQIAPAAGGDGRDAKVVHSVVFFLGLPPERMVSAAAVGLSEALIGLREAGHGCRQVNLYGLSAEEMRAEVRRVLKQVQPSHSVLVFGNREMYLEVSRTKGKLAVMGGDVRTSKTVRLGVRYGRLIEHAVKQLAEAGHRRVFIPCFGRQVRPVSIAEDVAAISVRHGVQIDLQWRREKGPEVVTEVFDAALARNPTAIIFPQASDLSDASSYLERRQIRIPSALSAVVLVYGPWLEGYHVKVAHFSVSPQAFVMQINTWLEKDSLDHEFITAQMISTWQPGSSIVAPEV